MTCRNPWTPATTLLADGPRLLISDSGRFDGVAGNGHIELEARWGGYQEMIAVCREPEPSRVEP